MFLKSSITLILYQKALDVTDAEGDDVTNDIFVGLKQRQEKNIWMVAAELGQNQSYKIIKIEAVDFYFGSEQSLLKKLSLVVRTSANFYEVPWLIIEPKVSISGAWNWIVSGTHSGKFQ